MGKYTIFGGELSLFSRKLEAAMLLYGLEFDFRPKLDIKLIETRAATHQVPVLLTPENWIIADTTPILSVLDSRASHRRLFPEGTLGVLVHVLEEFFDEWVARVMVHYRWHYRESAQFAADKMANGNQEAAERVMNWGPRACRATGTESDTQRKAAEEEYLRILEAAEKQLQETQFLLGDRPTALDCIVLGGLRVHTNMDPDPKKVVANFPTVVDWAERRANTWDGCGELEPFPASSGFAGMVLSEMQGTYKPFVLANRAAAVARAKAFHCQIYDEEVSYLTRPYPEQSRLMVASRIAALDKADQDDVFKWLKGFNLDGVFSN